MGSTVVVILSIVVALLTSSLVPVDIFLVSSFKSDDGTFHDWALSHMGAVSDTMRYAYYAMYALIVLFVFVIIPMAYFYFEAKDEEEGTKCGSRMLTGIKFTIGILVIMAILMCIGAFAISSNGTSCPDSLNSTDVKDYAKCRAEFAEKALTEDGGNNAISFTIGALTTVGVFYFMFYTATGLVALPLDMIRSRFKKHDRDDVESQLTNIRERQDAIRRRAQNRKKGRSGGSSMSTADRRNLERLQHEERVMSQATRRADKMQNSFCAKISIIFRPFEFLFGIVFFIFSIFLVVSLALTSGDKLLQITQQKLDWKTGYSEAAPKVPNPIDLAMNTFQKAFPVDYVLLTLGIYYLLSATMHGVRYLGVRFCGFKVFDIRRQRTVPQALLFMATIIMFTLLFINVVLLTLAPQYVTYGNQHYSDIKIYSGSGRHMPLAYPTKDVKLCNTEAPGYNYLVYQGNSTHPYQFDAPIYDDKTDNKCIQKSLDIVLNGVNATWDLSSSTFACVRQETCVSTRFAAILHAFFYNIWFFGAIYYWANWGFILIFFIALFYLTCKRRRSLVASLINDAKHDFDDSDDDMTPFNPSWAK